MWILYTVLPILTILILILIIRTKRFTPTPSEVKTFNDITLDENRIIASLQAMIQCKTISHNDKTLENKAEFKRFKEYLITRYPLINQHAKYHEIGETGVLFSLKGKSSQKPIVLMSHYDVVPENGDWLHNPFSGKIIDGKVYGRGTLDTKTTLCAIMESLEFLLSQKDTLKHDIYLAFSGDEETRGPSADAIVQYLKSKNVTPYLVLDEGGAVVEDVFPGVKKKAAMIGLAEKGYVNIRLQAHAKGGHASMPSKITPISELAHAVTNLNKGTLFELKKTPATMAMFDTIARHSTSFINRMVFANLWLFWPLVKKMAKKSDGELLSLLHTTQAFTQMEGSEAVNVLPSKASIGVNYRILTNETVDTVKDKVIRTIDNPKIQVHVLQGADPTSISLQSESYEILTNTIQTLWKDTVPTPYLMMAGTDSRYYHAISEHVYRFSPMTMTKEERGTIHSTEEAIRIPELIHCVKFYITLLKSLNEV